MPVDKKPPERTSDPSARSIKKGGVRLSGRLLAGPLIGISGKRGPRFPKDENRWDLVF